MQDSKSSLVRDSRRSTTVPRNQPTRRDSNWLHNLAGKLLTVLFCQVPHFLSCLGKFTLQFFHLVNSCLRPLLFCTVNSQVNESLITAVTHSSAITRYTRTSKSLMGTGYTATMVSICWSIFKVKRYLLGGESTLDLSYASPEEILELQHPHRATRNRRNLHCGDDSILRANVTQDMVSPCLGAVGASVWGSALLVVGFSVLVSILLRSLSMSGAALSTRVMGALRFQGSCS